MNKPFLFLICLLVLIGSCAQPAEQTIAENQKISNPSQNQIAECQADTDCVVSGCSGQLCISKSNQASAGFTTCDYKEEYGCFAQTTCGCVYGKCAWEDNPEFQACMDRYII